MEHGLTLIHTTDVRTDQEQTVSALDIEPTDVRHLRVWLDRVLRLNDNRTARKLLVFLNGIIWAQAAEQGHEDALAGKARPNRSGSQIWRDGYAFGVRMGTDERTGHIHD